MIDLFRNLLRDADPALPGARNPHVLMATKVAVRRAP